MPEPHRVIPRNWGWNVAPRYDEEIGTDEALYIEKNASSVPEILEEKTLNLYQIDQIMLYKTMG